MAKYFGEIGYGETVEDPPGSGVYVDKITEYQYYGDVVRNARKLESGEYLNNDITVGNSISVVADEYANQHYFAIRYIRWEGVLWTVRSVTVQSPRLILDLEKVYNGPTA